MTQSKLPSNELRPKLSLLCFYFETGSYTAYAGLELGS